MSLTLTKLSETASKITLGWTPVPGAIGYRFQSSTQAPKWSHTWDASRSQVTFSKAEWYRVEALGVSAAGEYPSVAPSIMLPGTRATLEVGEVGAWVVHDSPTTQVVGSGSSRDKHRVVCWSTAGGLPSARYSGRLVYFLIGFRLIEGVPGRFWDPHTQPDDKPHGWTPPGAGGGVSAFALDYKADGRGLHFRLESEATGEAGGDTAVPNFMVLSTAEVEARRRQWVWLWAEMGLGRDDTPPSGTLRIWVAGEDTPRVVARDVNTHYFEQHQVTLWEGAYLNNTAQVRCEIEHAATRVGRTPRECFEDRPVVYVREPAGNDNGPGGTAVAIADVDGGAVPVPTELRW